MMKKILMIMILLIVVAVLFYVGRGGEKPMRVRLIREQSQTLKIGLLPYLSVEKLKKRYLPLVRCLEDQLDRRVELIVATDYASLGNLLERERVDLGWFSHASFVQLERGKEWEVICRPLRQDGRDWGQGAIVVASNSDITTLDALRGKTFAYVDRFSGSGFMYPNRLFLEKGIDPLSFFGKIKFTHSHDDSIAGVLSGKYDGAAVYDVQAGEDRAEYARLRVLARTARIPNDPLVVRTDFDSQLKRKLVRVLTGLSDSSSGRKCLVRLEETIGISGFTTEAGPTD